MAPESQSSLQLNAGFSLATPKARCFPRGALGMGLQATMQLTDPANRRLVQKPSHRPDRRPSFLANAY